MDEKALKDELQEFLYGEQTAEAKKEGWKVDSMERANYCLAQIKKYEAKKAEYKALVDEEKARLDAFLREAYTEPDNSIAFFTGALQPYITDVLSVEKKKKSINLPNGTAGFRAVPDTIDRDEVKLLAFVKKYDTSLVDTKEFVKWADLKAKLKFVTSEITTEDGDTVEEVKAVTEDGEVVEGIKVTKNEPKFYVKVEG